MAVNLTGYIAVLNQTDEDAPVAVVIQNNTGETFTWTRVKKGVYNVAVTNTAFSQGVGLFIGGENQQAIGRSAWAKTNMGPIKFRKVDASNARLELYEDNTITDLSVGIYPAPQPD